MKGKIFLVGFLFSFSIQSSCMTNRVLQTPKVSVLQNLYGYDDPKTGCLPTEEVHSVSGVYGYACMPKCVNGTCPYNYPPETTAMPTCAWKNPVTGENFCILICSGMVTGYCPNGANCMQVDSTPGLEHFRAMEWYDSDQSGLCLFPNVNTKEMTS